jgi:hypothetical protein
MMSNEPFDLDMSDRLWGYLWVPCEVILRVNIMVTMGSFDLISGKFNAGPVRPFK